MVLSDCFTGRQQNKTIEENDIADFYIARHLPESRNMSVQFGTVSETSAVPNNSPIYIMSEKKWRSTFFDTSPEKIKQNEFQLVPDTVTAEQIFVVRGVVNRPTVLGGS